MGENRWEIPYSPPHKQDEQAENEAGQKDTQQFVGEIDNFCEDLIH
jgi:hypothetical protein